MTKSVKAALEVNVNDFVCFERIGGDYEWNTVLARVISIPTAQHVRVELFDRADAVPVGFAPYDNKLGQLAEQRECEDALNELAALRQQHQQLVEEEDRASESLYRAREVTQGRQAIAASMTRQKMVMLDQMRIALEQVPARSWRDLYKVSEPSEELFALGRALMIALQEDYNGSWESLQNVMRQPDFMSRLVELDCTVTPFSSIQRKKIKNELSLCLAALKTYSRSKRFKIALLKGAPLVVVLQEWLRVQVGCSEAREAEERVVDSCFAELQQQSLLLTEVNGLREMISMIEEQIIEKKQALVGSEPVELLTNEEEPVSVEGCFVQRVSNGRTVKDIIPRDSVLHVFGPKESKALSEEEGSAICVQLQPEELAMMQQAVRAANDVHDVDELEALFAAEERGEQEKRDLLQRMEELGKKDVFTEDDEEEMRQLDTFLTDVTRRHERTIWRRRCLQKAGRDKLYLEKRYKIENTLYSEMHVYFTGEKWQELLDNEEHCERLREAFQQDTSAALSMPQEMFTNLTFEGYPLKASFTTEHDRSNPKEALQAVLDRCTYPTVCAYYHSVTDETAVSMGEKNSV
uniref:Uncharacterized protein TCIL3000_9_670 n=1 Tax=Trypanosoma congolense (strain IL3000) TaxID=1068625 RepID=G0UTF9_TRYCI|nr:unnamed protein product [Trypanosoma congolense IL3000]